MTTPLTAYQHSQLQMLLGRWRDERQIGMPRMPSGPLNSISDVTGVTVGHSTLSTGEFQTGVTAIRPPVDNLFAQPLPCGISVLNGFSKPIGVVQVKELGVLQTPILLSNTLSMGTLFTALVRDAIHKNPELGRSQPTVNPLALECNDGWLNDIQALSVSEDMAITALEKANHSFARGSVGAGRGMSCFGLKGGIGTASRQLPVLKATLGVLVLANFGALEALTLDGVPIGKAIARYCPECVPQQDKGSIITIMATDAPLDARQLTRIAKRAGAGLGRLGSYWGHGSGDIAVAFSTCAQSTSACDDTLLETALCAAADATEHAVLDALLQAEPVTGFRGHHRFSLPQVLDQLAAHFLA